MTDPRTTSVLAARDPSARVLTCALREVKAAGGDGADMTFTGYGAVFGNVDSYGDSIERGAFKRTLREAKKSGIWPSMLSQHGAWGITASDLTPIGVYAGLDEDEKGLALTGVLAATPRGAEMHTLMSMQPRPAIDGLSIGYIPRKWRTNAAPKDGEARRVLTDVDLLEISLVTWPANTQARVTSVKACASARDYEHAFREVFGLSSRESKRAASAVWKSLTYHTEEPSDELRSLLAKSAARFASSTR